MHCCIPDGFNFLLNLTSSFSWLSSSLPFYSPLTRFEDSRQLVLAERVFKLMYSD
jgi:hypothetical protein